MKKIMLFFIVSVLFTHFAIGEEKNNLSFEIKNCNNATLKQQYITAVEKADFSCYRFKNKSRILKFEDGSELELFSASKLKSTGIDPGSCLLDDIAAVSDTKLKIDINGNLLLEFPTFKSKTTHKIE